jgi:hypothetical protein
MSITVLPPELRAWRLSDDGVRTALCEASLGQFPLLEAAYAWHERRLRVGPPQSRYLPIISADVAGVAPRLVRLLSPLTWSFVEHMEMPRMAYGEREWVQVPAPSYHRVARALNTVWRNRSNLLDSRSRARDPFRTSAGSNADPARSAAVALWRMAILVGGSQQADGVLAVRTRTLAAVHALTQTARRLQVTTSPLSAQYPTTVLIRDREQASALLSAVAQ